MIRAHRVVGNSMAMKTRHTSMGLSWECVGNAVAPSGLLIVMDVVRGCRASHLPPATIFHAYGVRTRISFVALSTAVLLKGNARGVTLRQSSS